MPHRRKTLDNICEDLIKKRGAARELDKPDDFMGVDDAVESSVHSDISDDIRPAGFVAEDVPAESESMIECFHCHEVFPNSDQIQRHMIERHVARPLLQPTSTSVAKRKRSCNAKKVLVKSSSKSVTAQDVPVDIDAVVGANTASYQNSSIGNSAAMDTIPASFTTAPPQVEKLKPRRKRTVQVIEEGRTMFKCDQCDFSALSPAALTVHQKTHDPDPTNWHKCHLCSFATSSFRELFQHGDSTHRAVDGKFVCPVCSKTIDTYAKARRHVWQTHVDMNVICKDCGKKFLRMERLRKHAASAHSDVPAGHCLRCGRTYRRKDKLKEHEECCFGILAGGAKKESVKKRSGAKCINASLQPKPDEAYVRFPFRCDICRIGFKNHNDLLIHVEARHRDQIIPIVLPMADINELEKEAAIPGHHYLCPYCQLTWSSPTETKLHIALDHPADKNGCPSFECPFCPSVLGRNYPTRDQLVRHARRLHRQLVTPFVRTVSSTNDDDVASQVEIALSCSKSYTRKKRQKQKQPNDSDFTIMQSEMHLPMISEYINSAPVMDDLIGMTSDVVEMHSPNFFSCTSLTSLSSLSASDGPYSETMHVVNTLAGSPEHHHLDGMSSVAVESVSEHFHGHNVHMHDQHAHHHCHNHHQNVNAVPPPSSIYDAASLVCYSDQISGFVGHDADTDNYMLAASPLPLPTSVLTACFDSPLTGPLNSHAYHLLE